MTINSTHNSKELLSALELLPMLSGHIEDLQAIIKLHGKKLHDIIASEYLEGRLHIDQVPASRSANLKKNSNTKSEQKYYNTSFFMTIAPTSEGKNYYASLKLALHNKDTVLNLIKNSHHRDTKNKS